MRLTLLQSAPVQQEPPGPQTGRGGPDRLRGGRGHRGRVGMWPRPRGEQIEFRPERGNISVAEGHVHDIGQHGEDSAVRQMRCPAHCGGEGLDATFPVGEGTCLLRYDRDGEDDIGTLSDVAVMGRQRHEEGTFVQRTQ